MTRSSNSSAYNGLPQRDPQLWHLYCQYQMRDLYLVGQEKPLGYLPFEHIAEFGEGRTPEQVADDLQNRGLHVALYDGTECTLPGGALYVWHQDGLQRLLETRADVLQNAGWLPIDSEWFVRYTANFTAEEGSPLFSLIADAFGDYTNPGRGNSSDSDEQRS